jgi:integrase
MLHQADTNRFESRKMPYVYLARNSKFWKARFRDAGGRWRTSSTKLTERHDAQKIAEHLEEVATGKRSAHHLRTVFNTLYEEFYQTKMPSASFREFGAIWLENGKPEWAPSSYDAYHKTVELFCEYLGPRADRDIIDVSRADVVGFRNQLAKTRSTDTTNGYLKKLRMLFKAAKRNDYLLQNPAEFVEILKNRDDDNGGRRALTVSEIRAVLAIADPEWQSLIKFGLYTGQRLGDIAELTFANIDLDQDVIRLVTGKTGKRLTIPIAAPLRDHLESLSWPDDPKAPVHPRAFKVLSDTGRVVSLSNQFSELLAQTGLRQIRTHQARGIGRDAKRERPQVSFHSLRHSAVSILKAAGIPHATVQELIGHESEAVSRHYTHVDEKALKKAAKAFPKL